MSAKSSASGWASIIKTTAAGQRQSARANAKAAPDGYRRDRRRSGSESNRIRTCVRYGQGFRAHMRYRHRRACSSAAAVPVRSERVIALAKSKQRQARLRLVGRRRFGHIPAMFARQDQMVHIRTRLRAVEDHVIAARSVPQQRDIDVPFIKGPGARAGGHQPEPLPALPIPSIKKGVKGSTISWRRSLLRRHAEEIITSSILSSTRHEAAGHPGKKRGRAVSARQPEHTPST